MHSIQLRRAVAEDLDKVTSLFQQTVLAIHPKDYSIEQLNAWAKGASKRQNWLEKIAAQYFLVAEEDGVIAGFGSITSEGYLDFLYVHKHKQGKGVAKLIYDELEKFAMANQLHAITTDVSITAKPFFEKQGFTLVAEQSVEIYGIELANNKMKKILIIQ